MAWRLARSLIVLREEVNRAAPNRSKISDGTLGDQAHAGRASRHNPNSAGVVCALDITNDPNHGMDVHALAQRLIDQAKTRQTNPDFEYVVSNNRIASRTSNWQWRQYQGSNPHTHHVHFAVGRGPDRNPGPPYDDTNIWGVSGAPAPGPGPGPIPPTSTPTPSNKAKEQAMWVIPIDEDGNGAVDSWRSLTPTGLRFISNDQGASFALLGFPIVGGSVNKGVHPLAAISIAKGFGAPLIGKDGAIVG